MACPFFIPVQPIATSAGTLPLGSLFAGACSAGGPAPSGAQLRECCNMGYSRGRCASFPGGDAPDAVRFAIGRPRPDVVPVKYSLEREHLPVASGCLVFDRAMGAFTQPAPSTELAAQALAYVQTYLRKL